MSIIKRLMFMLMICMMAFGNIGLVAASAMPVNRVIAADALQGDACSGLSQVDSSQGCGTNGSKVNGVMKTIVELLSLIAGTVAIIMIIVSGFRYMTSGGDSNKVGSAKSSLIYALIGVAVVALAQFLVHFVLNATAG